MEHYPELEQRGVTKDVTHTPLERIPPGYPSYCCREWELIYGARVGKCGLCGQTPTRSEVKE